MKTNVWRMYEAVQLTGGDQVALYDNGVGTSSFRPFAVLGGALGWGLKRNVRHLYTFACSNYRPGLRREARRGEHAWTSRPGPGTEVPPRWSSRAARSVTRPVWCCRRDSATGSTSWSLTTDAGAMLRS